MDNINLMRQRSVVVLNRKKTIHWITFDSRVLFHLAGSLAEGAGYQDMSVTRLIIAHQGLW